MTKPNCMSIGGTYGGYRKGDPSVVKRLTIGLKLQLGGLWVGAHYSKHNRRWCINVLPCVTVWVALKGGKRP